MNDLPHCAVCVSVISENESLVRCGECQRYFHRRCFARLSHACDEAKKLQESARWQ